MKRILNLRFGLSLAVAAAASYAVYASFYWPLRAALFPRVIGIPLVILAMLEMFLSAMGPEKQREGHAVDFELSKDVDAVTARKRTIGMFLWIIGLLILILSVGFTLAVPLFVLLYMRLAGGEKWGLTLTLTVFSWLFIEALFNRLLHIPFPQGWLFRLWS
jgi:hypothetical protein